MASSDRWWDACNGWLKTIGPRYPLGLAAIVAVLGIGATDVLPGGWPGWVAVACGLACFGGSLVRRSAGIGILGTLLVFAGLHSHRLQSSRDHPLRAQLNHWGEPVAVVVTGRLMADRSDGAQSDSRTGTLAAERIELRQRDSQVRLAPVRLKVMLRQESDSVSGWVRCHGRLFVPSGPSLPNEFDREQELWRSSYVGILRVQRLEILDRAGWFSQLRSRFLAGAEACRHWIAKELTADLAAAPEQSAVIRGMVLGDPGNDGSNVEATFRDSGALHLFAVSGLHVGLIAMVAWVLLRWLPLHRTPRLILLILLVFGYAYVTGWRPSAARAAWMIALMLSASLVVRRPNLFNSLGAAALVLLLLDSHQMFRPGFQLSFGVLISIIVVTPWALRKLAPRLELDPFLPRQLATPSQLAGERFRQGLASTVVVSVAAWLGSLPLMLWHFQAMAPIGLLANCLLVPLAFITLLTSCLSLCSAAVHLLGLQVMLNNANWCFASVILAMTTSFSESPGSRFVLANRPERSPMPARVEGVFFDIPNGGASMLWSIGARRWLWDTGSKEAFRFSVLPHLTRMGVRQLDGLILSHNDVSHIGGAAGAVRNLNPKQLIHGVHEPWRYDAKTSVLPTLLRNPGLATFAVGQRDRIELGPLPLPATVEKPLVPFAEVLYPAGDDLYDRADDRSLVWRIVLGSIRVLWMPDGGFNTEKALIESGLDLKSDLLIHTPNSTDPGGLPEFLQRVRPQLVITSNEFHLPEEQLPLRWIEACDQRDIPIWNVRETGAVVWRLLPSNVLEVRAPREGTRIEIEAKNR